ncbi:iron dependent repressor, metal binding and dimerization domain protein [Trueperella sp. LYQ143]|uniref:metal-dependent transcriptional regulator n=1 Tax=unclassified Trueperella TaxID=2630174 RepID=UPI003983CB3E
MENLSQPAEDYLKSIWLISEWDGKDAVPTELARRMGLSPSTVTEAIKKLANAGYVTHRRYGPIFLTEAGRRQAVRIVRKHRLIETFLHVTLGYSWEDLHAEAEALEHSVSDQFIEAIDKILEHPHYDPHGDPIPQADGSIPELHLLLLTETTPGQRIRICQVDDNAEILVFLAENNIGLHAQGTVISHTPTLGLTMVQLAEHPVAIPQLVAQRIRVQVLT